MFRRLSSLALCLSLAATALTTTATATTAEARAFAQAPGATMPRSIRADEADIPRISAAARARLRKVLASRRAKNVAAFRAYARRGVFPHNYVTSGALNVWTDEDGHLCAAATMIFRSGARSLVREVARTDNYVKLGDVTEGPLMDWILTSGLTQAEVAAIQEPFMGGRELPVEPAPGSQDWRIAEDARLRARYAEVLAQLAASPATSIDTAIDALAWRPDLVAKLIRS
jgi:hypothetical protein